MFVPIGHIICHRGKVGESLLGSAVEGVLQKKRKEL